MAYDSARRHTTLFGGFGVADPEELSCNAISVISLPLMREIVARDSCLRAMS